MMKKTLLVPSQAIGNFEIWQIFTTPKKETFSEDVDGLLQITLGYYITQDENLQRKITFQLCVEGKGPLTLEDGEALSYLKMKNKKHLADNLRAEAYEDWSIEFPHKEQASDWFDFLDFEVEETEETEETKETEETEETKAINLLIALRAALR